MDASSYANTRHRWIVEVGLHTCRWIK